MSDRLRLPVSALRSGDVLVPTNREVLRCSRGISTPNGYCDVDLRSTKRPELGWYRRQFRSGTVVTVLRECDESHTTGA